MKTLSGKLAIVGILTLVVLSLLLTGEGELAGKPTLWGTAVVVALVTAGAMRRAGSRNL